MDESIIVVSGLPRSGTSLVIQMLAAGGADIATDNIRKADYDNPKGYFEHEKLKKLKTWSFLNSCRKTVVLERKLLERWVTSKARKRKDKGFCFRPARHAGDSRFAEKNVPAFTEEI